MIPQRVHKNVQQLCYNGDASTFCTSFPEGMGFAKLFTLTRFASKLTRSPSALKIKKAAVIAAAFSFKLFY